VGAQGTSNGSEGNGIVGLYGTAEVNSSYSKTGVYGASSSGYGVFGQSTGSYSIYGYNAGGGDGVHGFSSTGTGVAGISDGTNAGIYGDNTAGGYGVYGENGNSNTTGYAGYFHGRVTITGNLVVDGNCNGTTCSSDIRLKKNVQSLARSLDTLAQLRPVSFEWKDPNRGSGTQYGFIAQEVEKVKPEWVQVDASGFKTVDYTKYPIMLVDSVRTLKLENDALKAESNELKAESENLRDRVKALEVGRRPMMSGFGEGGIGLGLLALAGAVVATRRKRSDALP
jgi:hypothetical protein